MPGQVLSRTAAVVPDLKRGPRIHPLLTPSHSATSLTSSKRLGLAKNGGGSRSSRDGDRIANDAALIRSRRWWLPSPCKRRKDGAPVIFALTRRRLCRYSEGARRH